MISAAAAFHGAKAAFLNGSRVLTLQRDDLPALPWPGYHDLPGGGREGDEAPEACLLRELEEEFGLRLPPGRLRYRQSWPSMNGAALPSWFFAAEITAAEIAQIRFGEEGQGWQMMDISRFLSHPRAIPALQDRLRLALRNYPPPGLMQARL